LNSPEKTEASAAQAAPPSTRRKPWYVTVPFALGYCIRFCWRMTLAVLRAVVGFLSWLLGRRSSASAGHFSGTVSPPPFRALTPTVPPAREIRMAEKLRTIRFPGAGHAWLAFYPDQKAVRRSLHIDNDDLLELLAKQDQDRIELEELPYDGTPADEKRVLVRTSGECMKYLELLVGIAQKPSIPRAKVSSSDRAASRRQNSGRAESATPRSGPPAVQKADAVDSEPTALDRSQLRPPKRLRVVRGVLLNHGATRHKFPGDAEESETYVAVVESDGRQVPVYGVDLERALAGFDIGQQMEMKIVGRMPVQSGSGKSTYMNIWEARLIDEGNQPGDGQWSPRGSPRGGLS